MSFNDKIAKTEEFHRLQENKMKKKYWSRWGPYLSEREWGTVREDYSSNGDAWNYFPHDHACSRVYRWGEDGIAGISDNHQRLCFAIALWNTQDPILKERLYGLTGLEGNHGEDVKEHYYYLNNIPSHAYMKCLYKYPQNSFPYDELIQANRNSDKLQPEFEILDTRIFNQNEYFDIYTEYAKNLPEDICIRITISNKNNEVRTIHVLPSLWFRNTWSWNTQHKEKPVISFDKQNNEFGILRTDKSELGTYYLYYKISNDILFTDNETNFSKLYNQPNNSKYTKDGINDYVVKGKKDSINRKNVGTKVAVQYILTINPHETRTIFLRLTNTPLKYPFTNIEKIFEKRINEADEFYNLFSMNSNNSDLKNIQKQAFAGLLWSKQFYYYDIRTWLMGDELEIPPPESRKTGRNGKWMHVYSDSILSMPDKWEYPWFAAWDTAFHLIPIVLIDPEFAKKQLILLTREWFMHPNGQIPAYEWNFSDANPPVHAWAAWRIYKIEKKLYNMDDKVFLERVFQKLLLNFTWWVNRKDSEGNNVFEGGFLGLDNIGIFDRSRGVAGGILEQADGSAWMAMYCLNLLRIALELAEESKAYEDIASKFFEHFLYIAHSMNNIAGGQHNLWNEEDGFYYDVLARPDGNHIPLKVRSVVGLIPLFAIELLDEKLLSKFPSFTRRMNWFLENRPDLTDNITCQLHKDHKTYILSLVGPQRLKSILKYAFDENEFLSPFGIRSVSKYHEKQPFSLHLDGNDYSVNYEPAESTISMFGGNSNWRGPIWFPINFLIIESIQKFDHFLGPGFTVEFPTGSKQQYHLWDISQKISERLINLFILNESKTNRTYLTNKDFYSEHQDWLDNLEFNEYFHGDSGKGLGARHQTGWTGLIAKLIMQVNEYKK